MNAPAASPDDVRSALKAASSAAPAWAERSAYDRGLVLFRLAEIMEARLEVLSVALGSGRQARRAIVAVQRTRYLAGFCDKFQGLIASGDAVPRPFACTIAVEPVGVVAIVVPPRPALLAPISIALSAVVAGNACVVVVDDESAPAARAWAECVAASGLPPGVVQVLVGRAKTLGPHLVRAAAYVQCTEADAKALESGRWPGLEWIERFVRIRTLWYAAGV